jgi:hypothetical protein
MEKIPVTFLHGNVSYLGKDSRIVWITHTRNRMELVPESTGFESWTQLVLVRSRISDDFYNSIQVPRKFLRPETAQLPKTQSPTGTSSDTIVEKRLGIFLSNRSYRASSNFSHIAKSRRWLNCRSDCFTRAIRKRIHAAGNQALYAGSVRYGRAKGWLFLMGPTMGPIPFLEIRGTSI